MKVSRRALAALLALSFLWGSSYLAVRWGVACIPPLTLGGMRHCIAGPLLWIGITFLRRTPLPALTRMEWKMAWAGAVGFIVCSDGGIPFAEQYIESSQTGLLYATLPIFTTLGAWVCGLSGRPRLPIWVAFVSGLGGMALLIHPGTAGMGARLHLLGTGVALGSVLTWAASTLYFKDFEQRNPLADPLRLSAVQMTLGGALLMALAGMRGEWYSFHPWQIPAASGFSCLYLLVTDCLIGFPLYLWLVRNSPATVASSYAFLSPLVALGLGLTLGHEPPTLGLLSGALLILTAVGLILLFSPSEAKR